MKNTILLLTLVATLAGSASLAQAGGGPSVPYRQPKVGWFQKKPCEPTYVCTKVVASRTECRWYTEPCGKRVSYEVKIVTLADVYSDGTEVHYTRTTDA